MPIPEELRTLRWGRYRPLRELGSGGMATVYLAEQTSELGFQRHVAIKRMHPHLAKDLAFLEMFLDEARVLTSLAHPHIVPLLDVVSKNGELLLVMDFVPGLTMDRLANALREDEDHVPPAIAVRIACDFLEGLHAAHTARSSEGTPIRVVHRDVSPHNVLVGDDGRARIFDFGIAKSDEKRHLTEAGKVRGKALYMAPEQLLGEEVDVRADVYAAGVTLWELLVGRPGFRGNSEAAVATSVLRGDLLPPHEVAPEVPRALGECVQRACSLNKTARFESALAFAEALELALAPASHRKVAELVKRYSKEVFAPSMSVAEDAFSRTSKSAPHSHGNRLVPFFVAGLGLASLGVGYAFFLGERGSSDSSATPPKMAARPLPEATLAPKPEPSTPPATPPSENTASSPLGRPVSKSAPTKDKMRRKTPAPTPSNEPIDELLGQH